MTNWLGNPRKIRRPAPWVANLGAIWAAQMISAIAFSFLMPFIPLYVQYLGVPDLNEAARWAGLISAATAISMTVVQPFWGNLADRIGRKPMVVRSTIGGCLIVTLMGFASSPEELVILRFIQGAVTGVVAAATALIATSAPKERLGFALGMNQVALFVGTSIGPLVGGVIADTLGYRAAFYAAGVLLGLAGIVVIFVVREDFVPPPKGQAKMGIIASTRECLKLAMFPILISIGFLIQLGGVVVSPILSLFIGELSVSANVATVAGSVLATTGIVSAASAVFIGRISDRVGHEKILPVCLIGAAISYFPQAYVTEVWQLAVLRMILGAFIGGMMPSANALVANLVPRERRGAAYGLTAMANSFANGIGPISGALIATQWGMRSVFLATGALFAFAFVWVWLSFRRMRLAASAKPSIESAVGRK